jgi:hypothetical protein
LFYQGFSQIDSIKSSLYSDFIDQAVFNHDSIFNKDSRLVYISSIERFDLKSQMDLESLNDYLSGNTENNELFQLLSSQHGMTPIDYFNQIPWNDFGNLLRQDSAFGYMILAIDSVLQDRYSIRKDSEIKCNYDIKFTNSHIPRGSDSWDKFYRKNKDCYGILKLSDVVFSKDGELALLYTESYHYSLFSSGNLVFMQRTARGWIILHYLQVWIS